MGKYTIHSTREDYQEKYVELKSIEDTFLVANLDWKKIKSANMDNLEVIISIIKRQVEKGLIRLK